MAKAQPRQQKRQARKGSVWQRKTVRRRPAGRPTTASRRRKTVRRRVFKRSAATTRRLRQLATALSRRHTSSRCRSTAKPALKPSRSRRSLPVVLMVADGWGIAKADAGNAVTKARTPNFDRYWRHHAHTRLAASGEAVGLPPGATGGSEVGHLTMGAGRAVLQELSLIDQAIKSGHFFKNKVLLGAMRQAKRTRHALHLMGLLSDAGIHSQTRHLAALLRLAKQVGLKKVFIHVFADGRDVSEKSLPKYLAWLQETTGEFGLGQLATIVGRYYAMDRDHNWQRTQVAYQLLTAGQGALVKDPIKAIKKQYRHGVQSDYYLEPIVCSDDGRMPRATVADGDSVVFFNFRSDRARQLTRAFWLKKFKEFTPRQHLNRLQFACFTAYDDELHGIPVAFAQPVVKQHLGEVLSRKHYRQLRIAETEKYAHVTYFFNAQRNQAYPGEKRVLVPSLKVPSYATSPAMSAEKITEQFLDQLQKNNCHFILVNFANPDLVGHSGNLKATIQAVETVDTCLGRIATTVLAKGGILLFTADHGNAEVMRLASGEPNPSHTNNQVPLILISNERQRYHLRDKGSLADLAPTILALLGLSSPKVMTGRNLLG